ncbi:MAG TPA: carbohydrate-binding protein, partial [Actinocrinis sp.]|uniref:carbohydrate-binding protein n=1 Tax=Actinocrinis sp. TaxID=1920516 RepID=UPI002DDD0BCF
MRTRRRANPFMAAAVIAAVTMTVAVGALLAPSGQAAATVACSGPAWAEGTSYKVGDQVTYMGHEYQALQANTPPVGAGWTPVAVPALWQDLGACTAGTTSPSASASATTSSASPSASPTSPSASVSPSPSASATSSAPPGGSTCAVKSRPAGKVIQGYWENWDGALNGVHPGLGWIPINDSRILQHGYNVINAAFPVILSDGTVEWQDGMDTNVKVDTP